MRITATALPLIVALLSACSQTAPSNQSAPSTTTTSRQLLLPLTIRSAKGDYSFQVEVARTPQEQEQGLMFRKSLDDNGGMIFPMNPPRTASFWMKNTLIPLDLLFIRTDGTIAYLKANATPYSREPISAGVPVIAVLELRGGRAAELGIGEGDHVQWGDCSASAAEREKALSDLHFCLSF